MASSGLRAILAVSIFLSAALFFTACPAPAATAPSPTPSATPAPVVLTIQENGIAGTTITEPGFVSTTGTIVKDKAGYTGNGFVSYLANSTAAEANIVYSIRAEAACVAELSFRYAFGGTSTNYRNAYIAVNGERVLVDADQVLEFPYTSADWLTWAETAPFEAALQAGDNEIRIVPASDSALGAALLSTRLANIDCLKAVGPGISDGSGSSKYFRLSAAIASLGGGSVSIQPQADYYPAGTVVTLTASPESGRSFESWTGTSPSTSNPYSITMDKDVSLAARFLAAGTVQAAGLIGYASVQDDAGTPYILTGGAGGTASTVTSLSGLSAALAGSGPAIVTVSGLIEAVPLSVSLNVKSNTTIQGDGTGHLKNIELKIADAENVIVRNLTISEVVAETGSGNDGIVVSGSRNVWIDHCEFHSNGPDADGDGTVEDWEGVGGDKDYFDGLVDIKNASRFVTVSWSIFRDHYKAILISSGPDQTADAAIRVSLHHNYFRDCVSRLPAIRFGKAHVFNNYYESTVAGINQGCVDARLGAEVYAQGNYFLNCENTVGQFNETGLTPPGTWRLSGNLYSACAGATPPDSASTSAYLPPYAWTADAAAGIPASVAAGAGPRP